MYSSLGIANRNYPYLCFPSLTSKTKYKFQAGSLFFRAPDTQTKRHVLNDKGNKSVRNCTTLRLYADKSKWQIAIYNRHRPTFVRVRHPEKKKDRLILILPFLLSFRKNINHQPSAAEFINLAENKIYCCLFCFFRKINFLVFF